MHGLGNDFVVFDARKEPICLSRAQARAIADRHTGVGCDQVIVIESPSHGADARMRIYNADGSEVESCGNAARCVARVMMDENGSGEVQLDSQGGLLTCWDADGLVTVDMGAPRFQWRDVPLAESVQTARTEREPIPLTIQLKGDRGDGMDVAGFALSMGNPHFVTFVDDAETAPVSVIGPEIERHPMFPDRTNVEFVSSAGNNRLRMRVFERGAGVTRACGTGACAAAVVAHSRGLTDRHIEVILDGGLLRIEWRDHDDHVLMTGPTAVAFHGQIGLKSVA